MAMNELEANESAREKWKRFNELQRAIESYTNEANELALELEQEQFYIHNASQDDKKLVDNVKKLKANK